MDVMVRTSIVRSLSCTLHPFVFRKIDPYHLTLILFKEVVMGGACGTNGKEKMHKVYDGQNQRKKLLGRLGDRSRDNIKMDLTEIGR